MATSDTGLTIDELAERFELRPRTIHFYIAQGLLPSPGTRGRSVRYGEEHQLRLEVIRQLTRRHVPLAEIKERLRGLSTEELRRLVEEERRQTEGLERARGEPSPQGYIAALLEQARSAPTEARATAAPRSASPEMREGSGRVLGRIPPAARSWRTGSAPDASRRRVQAWRRWEIAPGVELHASDEGERRYGTLIKRLLQAADEHEEGHGDGT
jgi:DNA-binding transcriptional MerR regulator